MKIVVQKFGGTSVSSEENRKKVWSGFYAHAKNKQHKAQVERFSVNTEVLLS